MFSDSQNSPSLHAPSPSDTYVSSSPDAVQPGRSGRRAMYRPPSAQPTAGMHWLRGFVRQFATSGGTVLISSHVLAEVAQTVDSVLILNGGRLVATRAIAELDLAPAALEALYLELTA